MLWSHLVPIFIPIIIKNAIKMDLTINKINNALLIIELELAGNGISCILKKYNNFINLGICLW